MCWLLHQYIITLLYPSITAAKQHMQHAFIQTYYIIYNILTYGIVGFMPDNVTIFKMTTLKTNEVIQSCLFHVIFYIKCAAN